jgi:hypothetical protein
MSAYRPNFGDLLAPGFRDIFDDRYEKIPQVFPQLFHVETSEKQAEKDSAVSGFGYFVETSEGGGLHYDDPYQMYDVTYTHKKYTKGFKVTEEMWEDDLYRIMNRKPAQLAVAAKRTAEYYAAQVFNNAFSTSYQGGDAKPLCSVSHPRSDGGTAQSNASATGITLNEDNLNTGLLAVDSVLDDRGMKIASEADIILVPRALRKTASILVDSDGRPETADNDKNYYRGLGLKVISWHYLTSSTAWFLIDSSQHQLNWFWRIQAEFKQDNAFETGMALFKGRQRFSKGFSDWRGVWGSKGDSSAYAS